jgi:uncharacterized protein DUF6894
MSVGKIIASASNSAAVPMARYYLHLKEFNGVLIEDYDGSEFASIAIAKANALSAMEELVGDAIKGGQELEVEAIVVADEHGTQVAAVPLVAALPAAIVGLLKKPEKLLPTSKFEEYRRNADDCRHKAENTMDPDDKMSWLKLADAWLQMLPDPGSARAGVPGWPKPSDEDSKASH